MDDKLYLKQGTTADAPFSLVVTPERAGWAYSGLKLLTLPPGGTQTWSTGDDEILVLPLSGGATVTCDGATFELQGRRSVFSSTRSAGRTRTRRTRLAMASMTGFTARWYRVCGRANTRRDTSWARPRACDSTGAGEPIRTNAPVGAIWIAIGHMAERRGLPRS